MTGHSYSIHNQKFPQWSEEFVAEEEFTLVIQVNGKVRDKVTAAVSISEEEVKELAFSQEKVKSRLEQSEVKKVIYIPRRLLNIVVK